MDIYNPLSEGYQQHQISALDDFIQHCLQAKNTQDLIRLNTYLRRYFSPLVIRDLFRQEKLPLLLEHQEIDTITALTLDIRGFVHTTETGEHSEGLDVVARLLREFFYRIMHIGFENRGLVGEFAGDRVLIIFGFPQQSALAQTESGMLDNMAVNVQRAVNTAFAIERMVESIKADNGFPPVLRKNFDVGIGIATSGPAWIGDIGSIGGSDLAASEGSWRQELTVVSKAANLAARAEEMTKTPKFVKAAPARKIIVDETTFKQTKQLIKDESLYRVVDLGERNIRGLGERVHMFHFADLEPGALPSPDPLTAKDRMLVNWISGHIDGAIERDVTSKVHRSLSDVGRIIVSSPISDEQSIFEQIMTQVIESFGARKASLYRIDPITKELVVASSVGPRPLPPGTRLPPGKGIAGWVADEGQPYISADVHTEGQWAGKSNSKYDQTVHSMMCFPLKVGEESVGVIQVLDDRIGAFRHTDLASLNVFAGLAAVAIENAKHYEQAMHMARARSIVADAFSSALTPSDVLDAVMVAIEETLVVRNATLYLVDQETGELIFEKFITESKTPPAPGQRLKPGKGSIAAQVVSTRKPRLILDTTKEVEWEGKTGSDMRSMVCVPLIARGQVVGAIQVLSKVPAHFTEEHLEILKWLSASAAVAVENAYRIEQARRKLIASETIAGMGAIAGKLAHNLKNYVTGIKVIAKYQLEAHDENFEEKVGRIVEAADKALAEVKSFMQPLTGWEATNVDLDQILDELTDQVQQDLESRQQLLESKPSISIEHQPSDQRALVYVGKDQASYIFANLIDNAIRAIDQKGERRGKITLKTSTESLNETKWAVVTVEDTGVGIAAENLEHIFERSFTTRPEGTIGGYGLFWVRLNVERMGGRITVNSKPGEGTAFQVRLPLAATQG